LGLFLMGEADGKLADSLLLLGVLVVLLAQEIE
jgi:hypothetical protein